MSDIRVLEVLLYGEAIGLLTLLPGDRSLFAFNDRYASHEPRPTLGMAFENIHEELITEFQPTQTRLMPFFSNLLPESDLRTFLARRADVSEYNEFLLLEALGSDLPGAVTVQSMDDATKPNGEGEFDETVYSEQVRKLRFSLAGVQLKISAADSTKGALKIPKNGIGGSWIIKLPLLRYEGVSENEFSMMTLARLIGMDVPTLQLIDLDSIENLPREMSFVEGKALAIQRFDRREDGTSVHIEDFAQVFNVYPESKYEQASMRNIAAVVGAEGTEADIVEFVRRLAFNTLIGNADMHLKNWSLIYLDKRKASLAPAYDMLSTIPYIPDPNSALKVSRTSRFDQFTEDELSHLAAKALLPNKIVIDTARETVDLFHQHWNSEKLNLPLSEAVVIAIDRHLKTVPIAG